MPYIGPQILALVVPSENDLIGACLGQTTLANTEALYPDNIGYLLIITVGILTNFVLYYPDDDYDEPIYYLFIYLLILQETGKKKI